jgi:hypothetical protein
MIMIGMVQWAPPEVAKKDVPPNQESIFIPLPKHRHVEEYFQFFQWTDRLMISDAWGECRRPKPLPPSGRRL